MTVYTAVRPTTDCAPRTGGQKPNIVVLHHTAGVITIDQLVAMMMPGGRTVSAHAAIKDRDIVNVVPEKMRAYALADAAFDSRALNAECINSTGGPTWQLSDQTHESIARWVADVCKRHGIRPHRSGSPKTWTVIGHREVSSIHGAGYATACPGGMRLDWIVQRAQQIIDGSTPTPTSKARKGSTVTLYYCTKNDKPSLPDDKQPIEAWAMGGDSPGTTANWFTTKDPKVASALANQHGAVGNHWVHLTRAKFVEMGARYLEPLRIAGGAAGGATADEVADELAERLTS